MAKNDFTRSNVNESMLSISQPTRSTFDIGENMDITPRLGVFMPIAVRPTIPGDVMSGSVSPNLALEKVGTPSVGKLRMDTHTFFVSFRRLNNKFRTDIQDTAHNRLISAPALDPLDAVAHFLQFVCCVRQQSDKSVEYDDACRVNYVSLSSLYPSETDYRQALDELAYDLVKGYFYLSQDPNARYGYLQDALLDEAYRLARVFSGNSGKDPMNYTNSDLAPYYEENVARVLCEAAQPYVGPGSICDMLGYPIINLQYGRFADMCAASFFTDLNSSFAKILHGNFEVVSGQVTPDKYVTNKFREYELRGAYCCWYDYMRDFHIEHSSTGGLLDPDSFDNDSLLYRPGMDFFDRPDLFVNTFVQLFTMHFRYWSRDALTTIQPDDVFRHVYSPIMSASDGMFERSRLIDPDDPQSVLDSAVSLLLKSEDSSVRVPFLSDLGFLEPSVGSFSSFKSDLQTMRRAGMLERYLARTFYHADTYSGMIEARFGVTPIQDGVLSAILLKADETFLTGNQEKANVTTDSTVAGQRTLVGDFKGTHDFTISTNEYGLVYSFLSLVPIRKYDACNPHLKELTNYDLPIPEFAIDTRVEAYGSQYVRGLGSNVVAGYTPRYPAWRSRVDSAHGRYLTDYRIYDWIVDEKYFAMLGDQNSGMAGQTSLPDDAKKPVFLLEPYQLHIHVDLGAFVELTQSDSVAFGDVDFQCNVMRALPAAVEYI